MRPIEYAGLAGLALIWGASYLMIKIGLTELSPLAVVAVRVVLGSLALAMVMRLQGIAFTRDRRLWVALGLQGLIGAVVPYVLITWGELHISSGLAAVLNATTPLFTVLLAPLWIADERLTPSRILGVVTGLGGVAILTWSPQGGSTEHVMTGDPLAPLGGLAIVGAALAYAVTALYARRVLRGVQPIVAAVGQIGAAALMIVPVALLGGPLPAHLPSVKVSAAMLTLGLGSTGVAYILYYWLIQNVGATRTSTVTYLLPPTALLWGALFLHEAVTLRMAVGLLLILCGVGLVTNRVPVPRVGPTARSTG